MPLDLRIPKLNAPGLKVRPNKDGSVRLYWAARGNRVKAGYQPETVRLHFDIFNPGDHRIIEQTCRVHQAAMLAWSDRQADRPFDGTIAGLIREFETHSASPYHQLKYNTRRNDNQVLRLIKSAFGKRTLSSISAADLRRWYDEAKKPKAHGKLERVRRAYGIIKMLRRLFSFGKSAELVGCVRLASIIEELRFKQPGRRTLALERQHVEAFIPIALDAGRLSLALGTAFQFETMLRQKDVIGEWEPIGNDADPTGITLNSGRWVSGLTWKDIPSDLVLRKVTTKSGRIVAHDLKLCLMTLSLLGLVPAEKRVGPLVIDERAGRPYAKHAYAREWRVIARKAGIPDEVWNMDARAGAITEAEDAGANMDAIRSSAGHINASVTARYSRGPIGKSREVAQLRSRHVTAKNDE
jgi:integrase